jgi:LysR family nitrogen assimilation transcriptional regulator
MDLKQLEYFVRVAELGSFTKAAALLGVAQPALSRQVRLLEVEMRQSLLLRNGRGATATEAGRILLEHGRGILHQIERAKEDLGNISRTPAGRVAVGLPPTVARVLSVALTREFRKRLPHASLTITEGLSVSMTEWLKAGRLDIALLYNPAVSADIELAPLFNDELHLIATRNPRGGARAERTGRPAGRSAGRSATTIALPEVAKLPLVIPSRPNAIRMLVESAMAGIGCRPNIALEIDGVAAILALVGDGAGYAILPRHAVAVASQPDAFDTRRIVRPVVTSRLEIATSSRRATTLTQKAMVALIRDVVDTVLAAKSR